jgi:hypothetical protein
MSASPDALLAIQGWQWTTGYIGTQVMILWNPFTNLKGATLAINSVIRIMVDEHTAAWIG